MRTAQEWKRIIDNREEHFDDQGYIQAIQAEAWRHACVAMRKSAAVACGVVFDQCSRGSDNWGRTAALECQQAINQLEHPAIPESDP